MVNSGNKKPKRFDIQFGYGKLVGFCFLGCLVLVWIFVLGVLVGRGAIPDPFQLPFLARFNWNTMQQDPPKVIIPESLVAKGEEPPKQEKAEIQEPAAPQPEKKVELDFYQNLEKKKVEVPGVLTQKVEDRKKAEGAYTVQLASFNEGAKAQEYMQKMTEKKISCYMSPTKSDKGLWYRVRTGRFDDLKSARDLVAELQKTHGIKAMAVRLR